MNEYGLRFYFLIFALFLVAAASTIQVFALVSLLTFIIDTRLGLYTLYIGTLLFGMGTGTYLSAQVKRTTQKEMTKTRYNLTRFQMRLSMMGVIVMPLTCLAIAGLEQLKQDEFLLSPALCGILQWSIGILPVAYLSYLTGRQLPMVTAILKKRSAEEQTIRFLFGYDYVGCLVGAFLFLTVLFPQFGIFRSLFLSSIISAIASLSVQGMLSSWSGRVFWLSGLFILLSVAGLIWGLSLENLMDNLVFG